MRTILLLVAVSLPVLVCAADPGRGISSGGSTHSLRNAPQGGVACGRRCDDLPKSAAGSDMQARQASGKAQVERQVAELHGRLRTAQINFAKSRTNFDLLGIKLGDGQSRVLSLLAKEFPQNKDQKTGASSSSQCVPRSASSRRNGDCIGVESKPSGDPSAYNPQTRQLSVYLTDKGRAYSVQYKQSNLYVANTVEGCERERDQFLAGVVAKYGPPFSNVGPTVSWGAAMPYDDFTKAYSTDSYALMGVEKSLDGDTGLVNDAQSVIYFQSGFALTAKCHGSNGERITMSVDAFLVDTTVAEQDSAATVSKPRL